MLKMNLTQLCQMCLKTLNHHATTKLKRGFHLKNIYLSRWQPFEFKVENFHPKLFLYISIKIGSWLGLWFLHTAKEGILKSQPKMSTQKIKNVNEF